MILENQKEKMTQNKGFGLTSSIGFLNMNSSLGKGNLLNNNFQTKEITTTNKEEDTNNVKETRVNNEEFEQRRNNNNNRGSMNDNFSQKLNKGLSNINNKSKKDDIFRLFISK